MNINKEEMDTLFKERSDPEKLHQLLNNFYEMSSQIAHHFQIPFDRRQDYIQSAVVRSWIKLDKFDSARNKHAFSYFYQVIRMDMMNNLRKEKNREDIVKMSSIDDGRHKWIKKLTYTDTEYDMIVEKLSKDTKIGKKARSS